jgi:hypothetical protein
MDVRKILGTASAQRPGGAVGEPQRSEAWLFAQALLGNHVPSISAAEADAKVKATAKRERMEWLAAISTEHARQLRGQLRAEEASLEKQELLEWVFAITTVNEAEWDASKHPRGAFPQNRGWFSPTGGDPSDPSRWYLPSADKGTWSGAKGDSTFRLKTPVEVNGRLVHEIQYTNGVPILDKFKLPGKTATIILTGESGTDIRNAEAAWKKLNPGKELPKNATFHHDLLHAAEETVMIDGKKTKVLVGKMHLVPTDVNDAVFHQGSASVARKYYQGIGAEIGSIERLAQAEASLAGEAGTVVARAASKIKAGKIAKGILPFVGRNVVRAIPLIGTGLAVLQFADNVEAHGVGGAVARAVPVLGDLISAHDLGSDLAKQIVDDANAAADERHRALNAPVRKAWEKANEQTIAAFNELAPQIEVTNVKQSDADILVDPHEVADALRTYRDEMGVANHLRAIKGKAFDFDAAAARNKQELKERLIRASQKNAPRPATQNKGPMA